jgi:hypothetical protein
MTAEIQKRLHRQMKTDENPLRIYRAEHEGKVSGAVLVTRVKAEHGGIEMVTGIDPNGVVKGVIIQSQREPAEVARAITNSNFLSSLVGKNAMSSLRIGDDLPNVASAAQASAQAIADGVRDELIVFSFAKLPREVGTQTRR